MVLMETWIAPRGSAASAPSGPSITSSSAASSATIVTSTSASRTAAAGLSATTGRSEEHTSELQSLAYLVCRLLLEKKKKINTHATRTSTELSPGTKSRQLDSASNIC